MSSKTRTLQRQQARKAQPGKQQAETRKFSKAEREELAEVNGLFQEAYTRQAKFVNFLRKQHDAPEAEGWVPTLEGFVKREAEAIPDLGDAGFDEEDDEEDDEADEDE